MAKNKKKKKWPADHDTCRFGKYLKMTTHVVIQEDLQREKKIK